MANQTGTPQDRKKKAAKKTTASKRTTTKKKVSSAADFKKNKYHDLELPSGNICQARRPGLQAFVASGKVPNSLAKIVQGAMTGVDPTANNAAMLRDLSSEQMADAVRMADVVVLACVVQPEVHDNMRETDETDDDGNVILEEIPQSERDDELLYIDEVDEADKNFIMGWAFGGTSDYEEFLQGQSELVDRLSAGEGVGSTAE